jgi:hypothetical protein
VERGCQGRRGQAAQGERGEGRPSVGGGNGGGQVLVGGTVAAK